MSNVPHAMPAKKYLLLIGLILSLLAPEARSASCATRGQPIIDLEVISDRGRASDRTQRIQVHEDGCVRLQRPPSFREPGVFSAQVMGTQLLSLRRLASDSSVRALDPQQALADARAASDARLQSEGQLRRTYVSHPTWYVLRLNSAGEAVELRVESVFQHAQLHPESKPLRELAAAIAEVLALDGLPASAGQVQP